MISTACTSGKFVTLTRLAGERLPSLAATGRDPASNQKRKVYLERETGFEPATLSLGSRNRRKK